ncbi:hypothetical protein TWF281_004527 [Arthrobotrys megalospora]
MAVFPLEIQYHILFFACENWLEQPVLRDVCSSWRVYIDTSTKAFLARYNNDIAQSCDGSHILDTPPRFHGAVAYHRNFIRSQGSPSRLIPCVFNRDEAGAITSVSREIDLSLFSSDPLFEPEDPKTRTVGTVAMELSARFSKVSLGVWIAFGTQTFLIACLTRK